jgi:hypothetical protein
MKMDFVPKICQGENAQYEGKIVIEIPKAQERHDYIRQSGLIAKSAKYLQSAQDAKKKGEAEGQKIEVDLSDNYELMVKMMGFIEKHIVKVDLKRKDGFVIDSTDSFMSIKSCEEAVMEIVSMFIEGFEPSKNSEA